MTAIKFVADGAAGWNRTAGLLRVRLRRFVHKCPRDARIPRADPGRRGVRRRAERADDDARPRSARLQLASQQCQLLSEFSRLTLPAVETALRISRSSIATTRLRSPTTSPTAHRAAPTTTKRNGIPSWRFSFIMRSGMRVRSLGVRHTTRRGFRTSAIPTTIGSTANPSTRRRPPSATAAPRRTAPTPLSSRQ